MGMSRISPWSWTALFSVPLLMFGAQGCDPRIPSDWEVTGFTDCRDPANASDEYFESTMQPFFDEYCLYCHASENEDRHGAPESRNYDTLDSAKTSPSLTWARVASFTMPPMGRLPHAGELDTLLDWLNCVSEAPLEVPEEIGECPDGASPSAGDVTAVLQEHCVSCHGSAVVGDDRNGAPDGIDWESAQDLASFGDDAYIWGRIYSGEMPEGTDMPDEDAYVIWEWLSCGSP